MVVLVLLDPKGTSGVARLHSGKARLQGIFCFAIHSMCSITVDSTDFVFSYCNTTAAGYNLSILSVRTFI